MATQPHPDLRPASPALPVFRVSSAPPHALLNNRVGICNQTRCDFNRRRVKPARPSGRGRVPAACTPPHPCSPPRHPSAFRSRSPCLSRDCYIRTRRFQQLRMALRCNPTPLGASLVSRSVSRLGVKCVFACLPHIPQLRRTRLLTLGDRFRRLLWLQTHLVR